MTSSNQKPLDVFRAAIFSMDYNDKWTLCWELMREVKLELFVGFNLNAVREDLDGDEEYQDATDEEVWDAIQTAATYDYSKECGVMIEGIREALTEIIAAREETKS